MYIQLIRILDVQSSYFYRFPSYDLSFQLLSVSFQLFSRVVAYCVFCTIIRWHIIVWNENGIQIRRDIAVSEIYGELSYLLHKVRLSYE